MRDNLSKYSGKEREQGQEGNFEAFEYWEFIMNELNQPHHDEVVNVETKKDVNEPEQWMKRLGGGRRK